MENEILGLMASTLDDIEKLRIATENRVRHLTRTEEDSDGQVRGLGLTPIPGTDVGNLVETMEQIASLEAEQTKKLQKAMKCHALGGWVKKAKGVGEKQAARLLSATGDPYWATRVHKTPDGKIVSVDEGPRTKREFLAYCGYGIAPGGAEARRIKKGATQDDLKKTGNPEAKMRAFNIAKSIVKAGGPYRDAYDAAREKYADAVHGVECKRCGPAGKPAQPGTYLSPGHQHARALRVVAKKVLTDLYYEAKRIHTEA